MKFPVIGLNSCTAAYVTYGDDRIGVVFFIWKCRELWLDSLSEWHLLRLEISGANGLLCLYRVYFMLPLRTGSVFLQWRPYAWVWMLLALSPCIVSWKADSVASILCEGKLNLVFLIIHGLVSGMCYCGTEDWRQTLSVFHSVLIWQNFTVFYLSSLNCQFSLKGSIAAAPLKSQLFTWMYDYEFSHTSL